MYDFYHVVAGVMRCLFRLVVPQGRGENIVCYVCFLKFSVVSSRLFHFEGHETGLSEMKFFGTIQSVKVVELRGSFEKLHEAEEQNAASQNL